MTDNEEAFHKRVEWLKEVVDEKDIYVFAEQAIGSALYFLMQWKDWVDIDKECENDECTHLWVHNVLVVRKLFMMGSKEKLKTKWVEQ